MGKREISVTISVIVAWMISIAALAVLPQLSFGADLAINMHGFSKASRSHEDITTTRHELIGIELCSEQYCVSGSHFRDPYGNKNNAVGLHYRYKISRWVYAGAMVAYAHQYAPRIGVAPELIVGIDGTGPRVFCVPDYKDRPGYCAVNLRIQL